MDRFEWGDKVIVRAYHIGKERQPGDGGFWMNKESVEIETSHVAEAGEILQTTLLCLVTHLSQLRKLMIAGDVMQLPPYNHELDPEIQFKDSSDASDTEAEAEPKKKEDSTNEKPTEVPTQLHLHSTPRRRFDSKGCSIHGSPEAPRTTEDDLGFPEEDEVLDYEKEPKITITTSSSGRSVIEETIPMTKQKPKATTSPETKET
ncbi:hypothetical protein QR680_014704 [Steinernema hermaphroditum]|uniref:Uncharacterized protein n=1 Tax=Steinernema hermaphroditum TaxID=289476 RepID=A0AA39I9V6_9BILA|nr:hypothetical protein QR680_014704 [Steinernema hermaphroditum]